MTLSTVYDRETHEEIGRITLEADEYLGEVGIGQRDPDEVYILETAVGGQDITNGEGYPTGAPTEHTRHEYETENHLYDATYGKFSINGLQGYSVTNRRLGHVKITAEKTWVDGDGSARASCPGDSREGLFPCTAGGIPSRICAGQRV